MFKIRIQGDVDENRYFTKPKGLRLKNDCWRGDLVRVIIIPFLSAMKSDLMAWSIESGPLFLSEGVSRKKSFDHCYNDSPEKTDERVEQAEEEQADDDEESVRLDAGEKITSFFRCESHENF